MKTLKINLNIGGLVVTGTIVIEDKTESPKTEQSSLFEEEKRQEFPERGAVVGNDARLKISKLAKKLCIEDDCEQKVVGRFRCRRHYNQFRNTLMSQNTWKKGGEK